MKKMKSIVLLTATVLVAIVALCFNASAAEWLQLSSGAQYSFDEDTAVMIVRGTDASLQSTDFAVRCSNHYDSMCKCTFWEFDDGPRFNDAEEDAGVAASKTKTLIIEEGITTLDDCIFTNFDSAEVVILPQSVKEIPAGAFYNLKKLRTVVLSGTTTAIGTSAFNGCTALESVYIPDTVKSIGDAAFLGCNPDLIRIPEAVAEKGKMIFFPEPELKVGWRQSQRIMEAYPDYGDTSDGIMFKDCGTEFYTYNKTTGVYTKYAETNEIGAYTPWNQTLNTNYVSINPKEGKVYNLTCRFYREINGKRVYSDYAELVTYAIAPAEVKVTASEATSSSVKLSWNKSKYASGYGVYQYHYVDGKWQWTLVTNTSNLSYTVKNLTAGKKTELAVRPYIKTDNGTVAGSHTTVKFWTKPATVSFKVTSPAKGKINVSWNAVNSADGYQLYYKTGNGAYKLYKVYTGAQNLTFANLKSGIKYTFVVRAGIRTDNGNLFGAYKEISVTVK